MPHLSKSEALIHLIIFNGLLDHVASSTARVVNRIYAIGGEGATTYVGLPTPEDPSRDPSDDSSFLQLIHSDGWTPARSGRPVASPSASRMQAQTAGAVGQAVIQIADWKPARVLRRCEIQPDSRRRGGDRYQYRRSSKMGAGTDGGKRRRCCL